ncbi:hypothetical protein M5K25_012035 [Dendrobium thyrsiflorum]|uniref:Uncharacterized protein n=1 Tax=Dendrobium thyrsiflorum TaxID=117978 RepID=A0ABD0V3W0_DENTH
MTTSTPEVKFLGWTTSGLGAKYPNEAGSLSLIFRMDYSGRGDKSGVKSPTRPNPHACETMPRTGLYMEASSFVSSKLSMADPEIDHGFVFDGEGRTDVLGSPFFDVHFGTDDTIDEYIDHILYQLTLSIEEHIRPGHWVIINRRPPPPSPATFLATMVLGFLLLVVISLLLWFIFLY